MPGRSFSHGVLKLLKVLNRIRIEDALERGCQPFFVDNKQVGLIRPDFLLHMKMYKDVLLVVDKQRNLDGKKPGVHLSPEYRTYKARSSAINSMLEDLRQKDVILALRGWRKENYGVSPTYSEEPLLELERAAAGLFGIIQYGVHVNGYTRDENRNTLMWLGRRSKAKLTYPDMYDNMCGGGLTAKLSVLECVKKECQEEASVRDEVLDCLKFVGTISYFYEIENGLFPECQFNFDLELPSDFKPCNADGEVGSFHRFSIDEVKALIIGENFKANCAGVCLDFLIRHGHLSPDLDPNISFYMEQLHAPLQTYYSGR